MKTRQNKIIAEFMGLIESSIYNKYWTEQTKEGFGEGELVDLKYSESWDWLIPVVSKCYNNNPIECNELSDITHALLDCNIDEVYSSVIVYIQKYNQELN
tara:strand:+ start:223 stop:522 length:300 start_codon:yes stop_codon:yes gene_type:complete